MTPSDPRGTIFLDPTAYADQARWHAVAAELRADAPVLRIEEEGYTPFWAVTRHEDVFKVSRDNEHFLNTRNSILGPDAQFEYLKSIGIEGETLIHMDGEEHAGHRGLANDWFRPRAVAKRQEAIEAIADRVRGQVPPAGRELRLLPGDRRAVHVARDHEHLRRARRGRAHDAQADAGDLRRRRPRVPR